MGIGWRFFEIIFFPGAREREGRGLKFEGRSSKSEVLDLFSSGSASISEAGGCAFCIRGLSEIDPYLGPSGIGGAEGEVRSSWCDGSGDPGHDGDGWAPGDGSGVIPTVPDEIVFDGESEVIAHELDVAFDGFGGDLELGGEPAGGRAFAEGEEVMQAQDARQGAACLVRGWGNGLGLGRRFDLVSE
jgi:hypothetical protein